MEGTSKRKINKSFEIETVIGRAIKINKQKGTSWLDPLLYNVGIYLMTPLLLGAFIGYSLDRFFRSKPLFVIIFLILGMVSSFYNFWKIIKK